MTPTKNNLRIIPHLIAANTTQRVKALTLQAEQARSVRALDQVESIADRILEVALPKLEAIGLYYKAIAARRYGTDLSTRMLEPLSESPLPVVRARAELALGANAFLRSDFTLADECFRRASRAFDDCESLDVIGVLQLRKMRAVLKGLSGDHTGALEHLEQSWSLARALFVALPPLGYDFLNSIATELSYCGQPENALRLIGGIALLPFAYPEWVQSTHEIARSVDIASRERHVGSAKIFDFASYRARSEMRQTEEDTKRRKIRIICRVVERPDLTEATAGRILRILG